MTTTKAGTWKAYKNLTLYKKLLDLVLRTHNILNEYVF